MIDSKQKRDVIIQALIAIYKKTDRWFVTSATSNRHAHLCRGDIDILFGKGYELTPLKPLSQPNQFAATETVALIGPKGKIDNIRLLGPARKESQVEISVTDSFKIGVEPVMRMSGELDGSPSGTLQTATGCVQLSHGIMISARHLHLSARQAQALNLKDRQIVSLKTGGPRSIILENVVIRCGEGHEMEVHLDTDEANAAMIKNGDLMEIL